MKFAEITYPGRNESSGFYAFEKFWDRKPFTGLTLVVSFRFGHNRWRSMAAVAARREVARTLVWERVAC